MICFRFKYLDLVKPIVKSFISVLENIMTAKEGVIGRGKNSQSKY